MRYLELPPPPLLAPYVQLFWYLELDGGEDPDAPERIAPDGIVELVLHLMDPMEVRYAGEAFARQPRTSLVSQTRRWVEIRPRGATGLLSVRFRPWGACHFVAAPISEIADRMVTAGDLWGEAAVRELEERLAAARLEQRIALVERFLLVRLARHRKTDVEGLVRAGWERCGQLRVAELCRDLGVSQRRLERIFAVALGTPLKSFARLTRFLHACAVLRRGGWESLTEVAHTCGYYDQPHFVADVKALAGMTPGELATAPRFSFLELR